jgi:viroplasmin and RNaseH domain-containing protein
MNLCASAEATAAAIEAAAVEVDVSAAENAAALGVHDTAEELHDKQKEHRRKRVREKTSMKDEAEAKIQKNGRGSGSAKPPTHEELLALRREKDRVRYASMSTEQRHEYNQKRREQYHRQNEISRQKRRERERNRYHALDNETAKERNERRAKLERERYQKLAPEELEEKNRRRRERAALARLKKDAEKVGISEFVKLLAEYSKLSPFIKCELLVPALRAECIAWDRHGSRNRCRSRTGRSRHDRRHNQTRER